MNRNKYTAYLLGLISVCSSISQISAGIIGSKSKKPNKETHSNKNYEESKIVTWSAGSTWFEKGKRGSRISCELNRETGHLTITATDNSKNTEIDDIFENDLQRIQYGSEIKSVSFEGNITSISWSGGYFSCQLDPKNGNLIVFPNADYKEDIKVEELFSDQLSKIWKTKVKNISICKNWWTYGGAKCELINDHLTITGLGPGAYGIVNLSIDPKLKKKIKTVEFKGNIIEIGEDVFEGCKNLEHIIIPNTVEKIGKRAFKDCENLKSIIIPDSVDSIYEDAFYGCVNLKSVEILSPWVEIGEGAFNYCSSLMSVILPRGIALTRDYQYIPVERGEAIKRIFVNCNSLMKKFLI